MPDESITMQSLLTVGISASGRQPKAIIAINLEISKEHPVSYPENHLMKICGAIDGAQWSTDIIRTTPD
jgi:hypothetical protein